jgi:hypothetical protein
MPAGFDVAATNAQHFVYGAGLFDDPAPGRLEPLFGHLGLHFRAEQADRFVVAPVADMVEIAQRDVANVSFDRRKRRQRFAGFANLFAFFAAFASRFAARGAAKGENRNQNRKTLHVITVELNRVSRRHRILRCIVA